MAFLTGALVGLGISAVMLGAVMLGAGSSYGVRVFAVGLFVLLVGAYLSLHFTPWKVI